MFKGINKIAKQTMRSLEAAGKVISFINAGNGEMLVAGELCRNVFEVVQTAGKYGVAEKTAARIARTLKPSQTTYRSVR